MADQKLDWNDPANGFADVIQVLYTDTSGGTPNAILTSVAMGVETYTVPSADAPVGRRFAVRGVNTDPATDVEGPNSNVVTVAGTTGPTFVSAYLWPSGSTLNITFSDALLPEGSGGAASFHVFVDGVERSGKVGQTHPDDPTIYQLIFSDGFQIEAGTTVTVSYDGDYLTDADGNLAPAFVTQPVTNDSEHV